MDIQSVLGAIAYYLFNFDGPRALQITYYAVALVVSSIGLWKTIRYAESKMPKRLLEFATREEGRIVEKSLVVLDRIKKSPIASENTDYFDVNKEIDRAMGYLDDNPRRAAAELHNLGKRLDDKVKVTEAQLGLTRHQAASVQLFFGALAQKVPERKDEALTALKKSEEMWPNVPEVFKEIGLVEKAAGGFPRAIEAFNEYYVAAEALDESKRPDRQLLLIDAHELGAECYRKLSEPDNERDELKAALEVAKAITNVALKPHALRARILESLGENARNRTPPQRGNMDKYFSESATEYTLAGLTGDAARVNEKNKKSAA